MARTAPSVPLDSVRLLRTPPARAELSAGRWLIPMRYLVGWRTPEPFVKVGSTLRDYRRYGPFLSRGGELLDQAYYAEVGDALKGEVWLENFLARRYDHAFTEPSEAVDYLGCRGAGYTECYRVPVEDWPWLIEQAA